MAVLWDLVNSRNLNPVGSFAQGAQQGQQFRNDAQTRSTLARLASGELSEDDASRQLLASNPQIGSTLAQLGMQREDRTMRRENRQEDVAHRERSFAADEAHRRATLGMQGAALNKEPDIVRTLRAMGIDPASPEARQYVKQAGVPQMTPTDRKAVLDADKEIQGTDSVIGSLGEALNLNKSAYSGPLAGTRGYASSLVGAEGGVATQNLDNVVLGTVLPQLKSIFGGNPTEGERQVLREVQGSVSQAPAVREKIFQRALSAAKQRKEFNEQRANAIRGGTYYTPGGSPQAVPQRQQSGGDPAANDPLGIRY